MPANRADPSPAHGLHDQRPADRNGRKRRHHNDDESHEPRADIVLIESKISRRALGDGGSDFTVHQCAALICAFCVGGSTVRCPLARIRRGWLKWSIICWLCVAITIVVPMRLSCS